MNLYYSDALLTHMVSAPSQYDSVCRMLAAEVLQLRSALHQIALDNGEWHDGHGVRDGGPAFDRVQQLAIRILDHEEQT